MINHLDIPDEVLAQAFLDVLRDPDSKWRDSPAWPFIEMVADRAGELLAAKLIADAAAQEKH